MNAAVSLTMCASGRLAWKKLPLYVFAQFLGSFLAAATIYAVYYGETFTDVRSSPLVLPRARPFDVVSLLQKLFRITAEGP